MEPQIDCEGQSEWLFLRFYDFEIDGSLTFNVVTMHRDGSNAWTQSVLATRLRPFLLKEINSALEAAGFKSIACFGDMAGARFDAVNSSNLVMQARFT